MLYKLTVILKLLTYITKGVHIYYIAQRLTYYDTATLLQSSIHRLLTSTIRTYTVNTVSLTVYVNYCLVPYCCYPTVVTLSPRIRLR